MASFFASIELHKRTTEEVGSMDYEMLHMELKEAGFVPYVAMGPSRHKKKLPTGCYLKTAPITLIVAKQNLINAVNRAIYVSQDLNSFKFFVVDFNKGMEYELESFVEPEEKKKNDLPKMF